jgi:hypothetical protein
MGMSFSMEIGRCKQALFPEIRWISAFFGYLSCTNRGCTSLLNL